MSAGLMRAALGYAKRGLPLLPVWWTDAGGVCACGRAPGDHCKPSKHPLGDLVRHGCKDATLDPRAITSWWRRCPRANIGIATGGDLRLLVIDVDPDMGGEATLAAIE